MSVLDAIRWYAERGTPANAPPVPSGALTEGTAASRAAIGRSPGSSSSPGKNQPQDKPPERPVKPESLQPWISENGKAGEPAILHYPPVFKVNLADRPREWLTLIGCADLEEAEHIARHKFGAARVLAVVAYVAPKRGVRMGNLNYLGIGAIGRHPHISRRTA